MLWHINGPEIAAPNPDLDKVEQIDRKCKKKLREAKQVCYNIVLRVQPVQQTCNEVICSRIATWMCTTNNGRHNGGK